MIKTPVSCAYPARDPTGCGRTPRVRAGPGPRRGRRAPPRAGGGRATRGGEASFGHGILWVIGLVIWCLALYASFNRNKGLSWSVLVALFFAPIYLIYCFLVPYKHTYVF